jgi:hypothetical protein
MSHHAAVGVALILVLFATGDRRLTAQGRIAAATRLRCSFTSQAKALWRADGSIDASAGPATLTLRFEQIDADTGVAQLRNGSMMSEVIVRASDGYLNFLQVFRTGPMYTTTVFDAGSRDGKFRAVHSRHEYFAVPLPGATSNDSG